MSKPGSLTSIAFNTGIVLQREKTIKLLLSKQEKYANLGLNMVIAVLDEVIEDLRKDPE